MLRGLIIASALWAVSVRLFVAAKTPLPVAFAGDASIERHIIDSNVSGASLFEDAAAEEQLLQAANQNRKLVGAPPLQLDERLRAAALAHARRIAASNQLEHRLPGEPALLDRIAKVISGDSSLRIDRAGENIANAGCVLGANDVLMGSTPHRENLLDRDFNLAGIAAIWSQGRLYVVQDFAHEARSYTAQQSESLVSQAVGEVRQQAGLPELAQMTVPNLDESACQLTTEGRPNARLLAAVYDNRRIISYTQSRPELLPAGALRLLRDPGTRGYAIGSCYARNAAYPTGTYWVAILLY
jgi:uncharacterized protein YkwD